MLISHISFSLGLIALVAGVSLYLWSVRAEAGPGIAFAKIIGIIVIILAILELICSAYSGLRWNHYKHEWREKKIESAPANTVNPTDSTSEGDTSTNIQINNPDATTPPAQNSVPSTNQPKSSS